MIYFDNAATTKPDKAVLETYARLNEECYANPASPHASGAKSSELLEKSRSQVARYLKCEPKEVIFTSGATESNNLAIKGIVKRYPKGGKRIITTKIEHASVLEPIKELAMEGYEVVYLDVDKDGQVDLDAFTKLLDNNTILVSIMAVNNETGIILPIDKLARITKEKSKAFFHSDATQAIYKVALDYKDVDLLSLSAHKLNGLKSSGVLVKRDRVDITPLLEGGGQESGYRSGTSNLALSAALATTLRKASETYDERHKSASELRNYLYEELSLNPDLIVTSPKDGSPYILSIALNRHKASVVVEALGKEGIMVSTKSACSSKHVGGSYVLRELGYPKEITENAIRLSFSGYETLSEGKTFIRVLNEILGELKAR